MYIYIGDKAQWDAPCLQINIKKYLQIFTAFFSFYMYIVTVTKKNLLYKYFYTWAFRG